MNLLFHLLIHIFLSFLAGFLIWKKWKNIPISFLGAFFGGVAVDFDHLIDYFLAFGINFNVEYFLSGYQFLKSSKIYILFHAWEYVIILVILAIFLKNRTVKIFLFSLSLGLFFHLGADCLLNEGMRLQAYSVIYRTENNFSIEKLVTAEHYKNYLEQKKIVNFQ